MISFLNAMGWTYSEYKENISWLENLIRGHFNDEEIPVLRKWFYLLIGRFDLSVIMNHSKS